MKKRVACSTAVAALIATGCVVLGTAPAIAGPPNTPNGTDEIVERILDVVDGTLGTSNACKTSPTYVDTYPGLVDGTPVLARLEWSVTACYTVYNGVKDVYDGGVNVSGSATWPVSYDGYELNTTTYGGTLNYGSGGCWNYDFTAHFDAHAAGASAPFWYPREPGSWCP